MTVTPTLREHGALRAVAAYGLPGTLTEFPAAPLPSAAWEQLLADVHFHRLTGHLVHALLDGALPAVDEQLEAAASAHAHAMTNALVLESLLLDAVAALSEAGVEVRILKGSATAHLDYPDPALRSFGDVDLLVQSTDVDAAVQILQRNGYQRRYPQPRSGFDARFAKSVTLFSPEGHEIDLHRTLVLGPLGLRVRLGDLWSGSEPFVLAGRMLLALPLEQRFLHACYHAALGGAPNRLVPLRDLSLMLLTPRLDVDRVRTLMASWRGEAAVAHAIRTAWSTLQISDAVALSAWASRFRTDGRAQRELELYTSEQTTYAKQSFGSLRAIPGLRDKAVFLRALVLPRREYLAERHSSWVARLRRGTHEVLASDQQR